MIPAPPAEIDGVRMQGPVSARYEDLSQDGHFRPLGLPHALGQLVWPALMQLPATVPAREAGVIPILSRMILRRGAAPLSPIRPFHGEGIGHRATVRAEDGSVDRILLLMWARFQGRQGATHEAGEGGDYIHAGEVYAEHIFTRFFGEPGDRRVRELPDGIPAGTWEWTPFERVAAPKADWTPGQELLRPFRFGMTHTDPNFHVNSLVYPRVFEEVALECLAEAGLPFGEMAVEEVELMWRKPFFAGDTTQVRATLHRDGNRSHMLGAFLDSRGAERCRIRLSYAE